MSDTNNILV